MTHRSPAPLDVEFAFTANVELGEMRTLGRGPEGVRRFIPIVGGTVEGPDLNGRVIAAGGDSQIIRSDDVIVLEARYMIQADDGAMLSVINRGFRHSTPEIMARQWGACKTRNISHGRPVRGADQVTIRTIQQTPVRWHGGRTDTAVHFIVSTEAQPTMLAGISPRF